MASFRVTPHVASFSNAGADATLQNVGPERRPLWDPDEMDVWAGTTSAARMRGKPRAGSREWKGL